MRPAISEGSCRSSQAGHFRWREGTFLCNISQQCVTLGWSGSNLEAWRQAMLSVCWNTTGSQAGRDGRGGWGVYQPHGGPPQLLPCHVSIFRQFLQISSRSCKNGLRYCSASGCMGSGRRQEWAVRHGTSGPRRGLRDMLKFQGRQFWRMSARWQRSGIVKAPERHINVILFGIHCIHA